MKQTKVCKSSMIPNEKLLKAFGGIEFDSS